MPFSSRRCFVQMLSAVVLASVAFAGAKPSLAQKIAVIGSANQFGYIDLSTRTYTQVTSSVSDGLVVTGLAFNGSTLYFGTRGNPGALQTLNPTTGQIASTIGPFTSDPGVAFDWIGLTFTPSGTLYSYNYSNDTIATVDTSTAHATLAPRASGISSLPPEIGKLAFSGGVLYGTMAVDTSAGDEAGLYAFATSGGTNGAATFIGNGGAASTYTNMISFSAYGNLYGINDTNLYRINTSNGTLTLLGALTGSNLPTSFAGAVAMVPEPSSLGFGIVPALLLGLPRVCKRRRQG